jgi:predicted PhzF superfamily epimerase YddE/YHI9
MTGTGGLRLRIIDAFTGEPFTGNRTGPRQSRDVGRVAG